MRTLRLWLSFIAVVTGVALAEPAQSQIWPQRPVRIIVPFAAGGNTDLLARMVAQRLGEAFRQQFVVENRPGAGGARAAEAVARSQADGYTLFVTSVSVIAIVPAMTKTSYDPVKDFVPISAIGTNPFVLVVHPSMPVNTLAEFVDYARRQPNKLSYVRSGVGGVGHLSMAMFLKRAELDMVPVTYSVGGAASMTDVIAGHVPIFLSTLSEAVPHATSGALRLLAVSSEGRAPQIPDIPTFNEAGFPGFKALSWNGLLAPAGTPREIIDRIAKEVASAAKDPKFIERLDSFGVDPLGNTPEEFAAMIAADIPFWAEAVKIANVQEK
jgi:tripartite-type tricarboxylate transporter receptor subunit TctC